MRRWPEGALAAACAALLATFAPSATAQAPTAAADAPVVRTSARLLAMADARQLDVALVDSVLRAPSAPVWLRTQALRAIGQVGVVPELRPLRAELVRGLIADQDTAVAATAAFTAGLLRDLEAIPALEAALNRPGAVHLEAATALGRMGAPAKGILILRLQRSPTAAVILALAPADSSTVSLLVPHLRSADASVRWAATYALTRNTLPPATPALLEVATLEPAAGAGEAERTAPSDVRAGIAKGLTRAAVRAADQEAARAALLTFLDDEHPHVRIAAVRSLASYTMVAGPPLLRVIQHDPDANVRVTAAQAAVPVFGPDDDLWAAAWNADTTTVVRIALLQGALRHGIFVPGLDTAAGPGSWFRAPDPRQRATAATAWIGEGERGHLLRAQPALADSSAVVQRAVLASLAAPSVAADPAVRAVLVGATVDAPDLWARTTAIGAVSRGATMADLPTLRAAYLRAEDDALPAARHAALQALTALWRRDSLSFGTWTDSFVRWPAPADARALDLARAFGPLDHWQRAVRPARTAAEWEALVRELVLPTVAGRALRATFVTTRGEIEVELFGDVAPLTVANLRDLAARGYFDGIEWHRVVPYFVAQAGDPSSTGSGGPGYAIRDELNRHRYQRGTLGMALSGPDTGGSQWFFTHAAQPHLDLGYTVFGRVLRGQEVVDALSQYDRLLSLRVQ
jgi:cyclophilin family peptidyl-prolyl cis-trans isomerase/HEAT repeat protein